MEWGTVAFSQLEGISALSVWDDRERRLRLVRDRFGIKPLHSHCTPSGYLIFGPEIRAISAPDCSSEGHLYRHEAS